MQIIKYQWASIGNYPTTANNIPGVNKTINRIQKKEHITSKVICGESEYENKQDMILMDKMSIHKN